MKILMINGSPHPRGCTYTALHEMERVLRAAGAEVQILTVGAEQIGGCVACGGCRATGRCVRGGLVNDAIDAMETADALVLASPVHYAGISGAMSAFCDRLFYAGGSWANKPCACVVSARRAGTTAALDQLVKYPMISNMPVVSSQYWPMVHSAPGGRRAGRGGPADHAPACAQFTLAAAVHCSRRCRRCPAPGDGSAQVHQFHPLICSRITKTAPAGTACGGSFARYVRCIQPCFFARRLPVMCSTVRHRTVVAGMTAFEYGKSGARYCAMSTRSARSLSASGTTEMRP